MSLSTFRDHSNVNVLHAIAVALKAMESMDVHGRLKIAAAKTRCRADCSHIRHAQTHAALLISFLYSSVTETGVRARFIDLCGMAVASEEETGGSEAPKFLLSRLDTTCASCKLKIVRGERIFPAPSTTAEAPEDNACGRPGKMQWLHIACAHQHYAQASLPFEPPVCQHWLRKGQCMYGAQCFYRHPADIHKEPTVQAVQCAPSMLLPSARA